MPTHFIEVYSWKNGEKIQVSNVLPIDMLHDSTNYTHACGLKTVAVFKITPKN